jgi:hypothetical protein
MKVLAFLFVLSQIYCIDFVNNKSKFNAGIRKVNSDTIQSFSKIYRETYGGRNLKISYHVIKFF